MGPHDPRQGIGIKGFGKVIVIIAFVAGLLIALFAMHGIEWSKKTFKSLSDHFTQGRVSQSTPVEEELIVTTNAEPSLDDSRAVLIRTLDKLQEAERTLSNKPKYKIMGQITDKSNYPTALGVFGIALREDKYNGIDKCIQYQANIAIINPNTKWKNPLYYEGVHCCGDYTTTATNAYGAPVPVYWYGDCGEEAVNTAAYDVTAAFHDLVAYYIQEATDYSQLSDGRVAPLVGYFSALRAADGKSAQLYIDPSERNKGRNIPKRIGDYYSALEQPIQLIDIFTSSSGDIYAVYSLKKANESLKYILARAVMSHYEDGWYLNKMSNIAEKEMGVVTYADSPGLRFKEYYFGLPKYRSKSPFNNVISSELGNTLATIQSIKDSCVDSKGSDDELFSSNVCNQTTRDAIKTVINQAAPSLDPSLITLLVYDLNADGNLELIVEYLIKDSEGDLYTAIWIISKASSDQYIPVYAGTYLRGRVQSVSLFAQSQSRSAVFIRYESCTECHSTTYLSAVDSKYGKEYEFTYDNTSWDKAVEYILPGHGHTIDADIEIRIPTTYTIDGPHMLQYFKMIKGDDGIVSGEDEWWLFTCKSYRCSSEKYIRTLPEAYVSIWKDAHILKELKDK